MGNPIQVSSVPAQMPYVQYVASSGQTAFDYPFEITEDSDLVVLVNSVEQGLDTGYSLTGQGNSTGGTLTFTTGQTAGTIITLYRDITIERITQLTQNGGFFSSAFNAEYNRIYMILQQLQESIDFCLQIPFSNNPAPNTTLTPANYANKYLAFDGNGNPEPALLTSSGTLTASLIGGLLYPQSTAEVAASVTPSDLQYPYGDVRRYGADPSGTNDSTTAIQNALSCNPVVFDGNPGQSLYKISQTLTYAFAGQIFRGNGSGDSNTGSTSGPRTTLSWSGSAGGTMLSAYNGTENLSEIVCSDMALQGNSVAGIGIQAYNEAVSSGAWRQRFRNVTILNCNDNASAVTFTSSPSGTSGTLTAAWTGVTGYWPLKFSDSEVRAAYLQNGSTAVSWNIALTGSPTTSASVDMSCAFFFGNGTSDANSNDTTLESCFVYNCGTGYMTGASTAGLYRVSFDDCHLGISGTSGINLTTLDCIFFGNVVDVCLENAQNWSDQGSTYQNSTMGIFYAATAATVSMVGSSLHTSNTTNLMNLNSVAGDMTFAGCFVSSDSSSTLIQGQNSSYNYDFSTINCTLPTSFGYKRRVQGAGGLENIDNAKFLIGLTNSSSDVTGDGTQINVFAAGCTKAFDLSSAVDSSTGVFTAPVAGYYTFVGKVAYTGITSSYTDAQLLLVVGGTDAQTYSMARINPGAVIVAGASEADLAGTITVAMAQGDTATLETLVSNSSKDIGVLSGGTSTNYRTFFQGQLA